MGESRKKSRRRRKTKRSASLVSSSSKNNAGAGSIVFFLLSSLLFIAVMTNFALHSYLPDGVVISAASSEVYADADVQEKAGLRGGGRTNKNDYSDTANNEAADPPLPPRTRDLRPIDHVGGGGGTTQDSPPNDDDEEGQKEILRVLQEAGIKVDDATLKTLPKWSDLTSMYGPKPIIYGLNTCHKFQTMQDPADAYIAPAGIFNTGTNLLANLLGKNCYLPEKRRKYGKPGMRQQVPWGKHNPVNTFRLHNFAKTEGKERIDQRAVLPVVTTKDPYGWFGSMCRHEYAARWPHRGHCPNLVLDDQERRMGGRDNGIDGGVPVRVFFGAEQKNITHYESLAGMWNDWYGDYFEIDEYPRLIVRFEDVMMRPKEVVTKVCECGGGKIKDPNNFIMMADSAKGEKGTHKGSSGLITALTRYGDTKKRVEGMTEADLDYARKHLRSDLMEAFGYAHPPKR